jgi:hypothetical protein
MPKDTHSTLPTDAELVLPEQVTIAVAELAGAAREGLLALAVGTGLGVLESLLEADMERLVGPNERRAMAIACRGSSGFGVLCCDWPLPHRPVPRRGVDAARQRPTATILIRGPMAVDWEYRRNIADRVL